MAPFFNLHEIPQSLPSGPDAVLLQKSNLSIEDRTLYMEVWSERTHVCQSCSAPLFEPLLFMFHHVLEKREKQHASYVDFSAFRHCKWNIMVLCWACHTTCDTNPASKVIRKVMDYRDRLLIILELDYQYDRDHIWLASETLDLSAIQQLFANVQILLNE